MNPQDLIDLERTLQQQTYLRAVLDEAFRRKLLTGSPKAVQELLERELGFTFPSGVTVQVQQGVSLTIHLVPPIQPQPGEPAPTELSKTDLEQAVGGGEGKMHDSEKEPGSL